MSTTVMTANIGSTRRRVRQLLVAIATHRPDVVVVSEAYHARWWLLLVRGYKLRQYSRLRGPEAPGIAFLVRRGLPIVRRWPMRMTRRWHGPHGREHAPRVLPVLVLEDVAVLGMHAPWPHDSAAWRETWRRATLWLEHNGRRLTAGDLNATVGELARELDGHNDLQLVVGTKVDHAVTHNVRHLWTKRLGDLQPEGMHGWVFYSFQAGEA